MTALNNRFTQMTDAQLEQAAWSYEGAYQCGSFDEDDPAVYRSWYEDVVAMAKELRNRGLHVPFEVLGWDDCDDELTIDELAAWDATDALLEEEAYTEADAWCDARERDGADEYSGSWDEWREIQAAQA